MQDKRSEVKFTASVVGEGKSNDHLDPSRRAKELNLVGIGSVRNQVILDAGCGPGTYGLVLARNGNTTIGIDLSPDAISTASHWAHVDQLNYLPMIADIENLPFGGSSFDICFCGHLLHHLPDPNTAVKELCKVLKPGGALALIEPNGSNPAVKLGGIIGRLFLSRQLEHYGYTSPNESARTHKVYFAALEKAGLVDIRIASHTISRMEPKPKTHRKHNYMEKLLAFLLALRSLLYILIAKLLPQPYKHPTIYITAVLPSEDTK